MNLDKRLRIAVLGDIFDDAYHVGGFGRPSPEGGAPIFAEERCIVVAGGAGNTHRQLEHWNVDADLYGCHVGVKRRYVADGRCAMRADCEQEVNGAAELLRLLPNLDRYDGLLISDYDKGTLTEQRIENLLAACMHKMVPVFVDPKHKPPEAYLGCAVLKFNDRYCRQFSPKLVNAVCTRGALPPLVGGRPLPPRPAVAAASVVGAGDCFHAALACCWLRGMRLEAAAEAAYCAGRCYVQHQYNRPVHPLEVQRDLDPAGGKVVSAARLADWLAVRQPKAVFTCGVFSMLHPGHLHTLRWAKQKGEVLIVGVNDDASAARLKPGRVKLSCFDRLKMLAALECVDWVVPFSEDNPLELLKVLGVTTVVKGHDYQDKDIVERQVAEVQIAPAGEFLKHCSDF